MSNLHFELAQVQKFIKNVKTIEDCRKGTQLREQYLRRWYGRDYKLMHSSKLCQQLRNLHATMYRRVLAKGIQK